MEDSGILRPAILQVNDELPPLPPDTMTEAHAYTLAWLKVRTATAQDLRKAVSDVERFTGETGELNHFIKSVDRVMARIEAKRAEDLLDGHDAASLRADLICRVKRNVLNLIQGDEETPWEVIKERLKKAYGGGRWTPEEDLFQLFRETKHPRQSGGKYAGELLARFNKVTDKLRETESTAEVEAKMAFVGTILKIQLARETGKRENFSREKSFIECAQELMDSSAREEEFRAEDMGWTKVEYRRPVDTPWRRREMEPRPRPAEQKGRGPRRSAPNSRKREDRRCHGCGKPGHLVAQCPRTKCFECGNEGHIARQCPYIYRRFPKEEPMEINRVWRRQRRPSESSLKMSEVSATSETEREDEPGGSEEEGAAGSRRRSGGRRRTGTTGRVAA